MSCKGGGYKENGAGGKVEEEQGQTDFPTLIMYCCASNTERCRYTGEGLVALGSFRRKKSISVADLKAVTLMHRNEDENAY